VYEFSTKRDFAAPLGQARAVNSDAIWWRFESPAQATKRLTPWNNVICWFRLGNYIGTVSRARSGSV
jgi:hypothetical protein